MLVFVFRNWKVSLSLLNLANLKIIYCSHVIEYIYFSLQAADGACRITPAMSKNFKLFDRERPTSTSSYPSTTNWNLCIICQDDTEETLTRPSQSKRTDIGSGYSSLAQSLIRFNELKELPHTLQLCRLDEGDGIEVAMVANNAGYHQTCRLKYNRTKLQRAEKRKRGTVNDSDNTSACKHTRSLPASRDKSTISVTT